MKPAPFEYARPSDVDEACAMLAADDGARLIAGGQTLVPLMAMRLARPSRIIDIARIPGLSFIREQTVWHRGHTMQVALRSRCKSSCLGPST